MILLLSVVRAVGSEVWGKRGSHIGDLPGRTEGKKIVDVRMAIRRYLQGGMIGGMGGAGRHGVNL